MTDNKTNIILETDIGNDIDDVLALMMLHTLASQGYCDLVGVSINKSNIYSAIFTDIINTFYGRPEIPIGLIEDGLCAYDGKFSRPICEAEEAGFFKYPRNSQSPQCYYDSINLLRKLLAESEDASVTIVSIGLLTNLARLLVSCPDQYSDYNGEELFRRKVKLVSCMGGNFSPQALMTADRSFAEFNIVEDIQSAKYFIKNCPSDIVFSGWEVGIRILYPVESILNDFNWAGEHPGAQAYKLFKPMPYDRPLWDLTAALYAVFPDIYFGLSPRGTVGVNGDGVTTFRECGCGKHRYMTMLEDSVDVMKELFVKLCSRHIHSYNL